MEHFGKPLPGESIDQFKTRLATARPVYPDPIYGNIYPTGVGATQLPELTSEERYEVFSTPWAQKLLDQGVPVGRIEEAYKVTKAAAPIAARLRGQEVPAGGVAKLATLPGVVSPPVFPGIAPEAAQPQGPAPPAPQPAGLAPLPQPGGLAPLPQPAGLTPQQRTALMATPKVKALLARGITPQQVEAAYLKALAAKRAATAPTVAPAPATGPISAIKTGHQGPVLATPNALPVLDALGR